MGQLEVLLREGRSLSGRERNVVMLNTGVAGRRFADVSAVSGFDVDGDGRGLALTDWDADGDLDVWVSNRTAPTVQFFENRGGAEAGDAVAIELEGVSCNRDAIGARVVVELAGGERLLRTVRAGSGFQSQSGMRLHFGLGKGAEITGVGVRWPGTEAVERVDGIGVGGFYRVRQGERRATREVPEAGRLGSVGERVRAGDDGVVLLPVRPVFPKLVWRGEGGEEAGYDGGEPLLVMLWQPGCEACLKELGEIGELDLGLRTVALTGAEGGAEILGDGFRHEVGMVADDVVDRILVLHRHLFYRPYQLQVPVAFLLDGSGALAAVYRSGIDAEGVREDVAMLEAGEAVWARRASVSDGVWVGGAVGERPAVLIEAYLGEGMTDEAERVFRARRAHVTVAAQAGEIARAIGDGYLYSGAYAEAERLLTEACSLDAGLVKALNNLAALKLRKGEAGEARRLWEEAVEADASYAAPRLNLGKLLMKEGQTEAAMGLLEEFVQLDGESADGRHYLAMGYLRGGMWERARDALEVLLRLRPGDRAARENLAKVYLQLGKPGEARRVMEAGR